MKVTLNGPVEHHAEMLRVAHGFAAARPEHPSGQWFAVVYLLSDAGSGYCEVHWTTARAVVATYVRREVG